MSGPGLHVGAIVLTYRTPLGLTLKRYDDGVPPQILQTLRAMQAQAEAEGVTDPGRLHIEGDELVLTLETDAGLIVAAASCYQTSLGDLFLQFIYVQPVRRRQGCGTCLWSAVVGLARALQCPHIEAISKPNNAAMAALYRKVGAGLVGHIYELNLANLQQAQGRGEAPTGAN